MLSLAASKSKKPSAQLPDPNIRLGFGEAAARRSFFFACGILANVYFCEGFRMPAAHGDATYTGGRRPKASKGGNRDRGRWGGAARALWRFERDCCRG